MLLRPYNKRESTLPSHCHRYSQISSESPFNEFLSNEAPDIAVIKKARKLMQSKEQLLLNRINVIKKEEEKIIKRKQNDFKLFVKLQAAKKDCFMSLNKTPRKLSFKQNYTIRPMTRCKESNLNSRENTLRSRENTLFQHTKRNNHQSLKNMQDECQEKFTAQRLYLEKIQNAKRLKQQKSKNQLKINKQRTLQLNRKLQSAGMVRKNREKVKETRQNFYRSRQESIKHFKVERMEQERQKFMEIQKHIKNLEHQEIEALQKWKKVSEDDECELAGLRDLEINEANCWMN